MTYSLENEYRKKRSINGRRKNVNERSGIIPGPKGATKRRANHAMLAGTDGIS